MRLLSISSILFGVSFVAAAPTVLTQRNGLTYQSERSANGESPDVAKYRADAVKEAFQFAWDGYYKYAFPNDELCPIDNSFHNSRNGWGASAVDALSTAIVMELPEVVSQITEYIPTIDWSVSYNNSTISLFETTIRYLGGLLSGYDLLSGAFEHLVDSRATVDALLTQAQQLANNLSYAFDTPTGIPSNGLQIESRTMDGSTSNGLATVGTLVLEWTRLSDLVGDTTYGDLARRAEEYLLAPRPEWAEPWPGLLGSSINIETGLFENAAGGWGAGDDSFYEYLIKMYVYDSSRFASCKDRWVMAADSTIKHLASHPSSRPDLTFLASFSNKTLQYESGHLACFNGGNFILGGLVLNEKKYIDFGLELVHSCEVTYSQTLTGIGPEGFAWDGSTVPADQIDFFEQAGFYITSSGYDLRPEVMESFYYAYRATGNRMYQDNAFKAINATARVGSGFAGIMNVNSIDIDPVLPYQHFVNFQESFFFAEVLKYSYLIHAEGGTWQVNHGGVNEWIFNTEGHLLKVAGRPI